MPQVSHPHDARRLIVHIGVHKTGTSTLQDVLFANRDRLERQGVLYRPPPGDWNNHHLLANAFRKGLVKRPPWLDEYLDGLARDGAGRTVLLSSEIFCELTIDLVRLQTALKRISDRPPKIIAYLRHPVDQLVSALNQVIRSPRQRRSDPISVQRMGYDLTYPRVRAWTDYGDLTICPYDRDQWPDGSLVRDFLGMIGVDGNGLELERTSQNTSLPAPFIEILRQLNATGIDEPSRQQIIAVLQQAQLDPWRHALPEDVRDAAYARMANSLEWMQPHLRPGFQTDYLFAPRD